jgi:rhodanese-related sulfurtransferase
MEVTQISVDQLTAVLSDGEAVIVDVREPDEYVLGHVPGAVLVPLGTVQDRVEAFSGSPTYVICRSGARSQRACEFLLTQGREVVNVAGGTMAWIDAGFEVETGNS